MEPLHKFGVAGLVTMKIICCGALALTATGMIGFAGIANWLLGASLFRVAAVTLAVIGIVFWFQSKRQRGSQYRKDTTAVSHHELHK